MKAMKSKPRGLDSALRAHKRRYSTACWQSEQWHGDAGTTLLCCLCCWFMCAAVALDEHNILGSTPGSELEPIQIEPRPVHVWNMLGTCLMLLCCYVVI